MTRVYQELLTVGRDANEMYLLPVPEGLVGRDFVELRACSSATATTAGLPADRHPARREDDAQPGRRRGRPAGEGDELILLSQNLPDLRELQRPAGLGSPCRDRVSTAIKASAGMGDLLLRVTPPRVPRHLLSRPRLMSGDDRLRGCPVVVVQAPAGFGKTSLLAQWRLEHLARGAVVAWLTAQRRDAPRYLVQALTLAVRQGAGRPAFGHTLLEAPPPNAIEGITSWLADVAQTALDTVLIVDEAEHLPPESVRLLEYLLRNAPANLRVVVAARADCRSRHRRPDRVRPVRRGRRRRCCASSSPRRSRWSGVASAPPSTSTRPPACTS